MHPLHQQIELNTNNYELNSNKTNNLLKLVTKNKSLLDNSDTAVRNTQVNLSETLMENELD